MGGAEFVDDGREGREERRRRGGVLTNRSSILAVRLDPLRLPPRTTPPVRARRLLLRSRSP